MMGRTGIARILLVTSLTVGACSSTKTPVAPHPPQPATLWVLSTPGGVPVTIDGAATGKFTPDAFSVAAGSHTVGLQLLGYRDTIATVSPTTAAVETLSVALGPGPGTPRSFSRWQTLPYYPTSIATSATGPVFVTLNFNHGELLVFSQAGATLGTTSLAYDPAINLTVAPSGDAYYARYVSGFGWVVERATSGAVVTNTLDSPYLSGPAAWPGSDYEQPLCPTVGTGDTLEVLFNAPTQGVTGEVHRYVNDTHIDSWFTGLDAKRMVIDGAARRCYLMGASDTVWVVSSGGHLLRSLKAGASEAFTVAPDGTVFVADASVIRRFTGDGALLAAWSTGNAVAGIAGLAVDGAGRVYVADFGNQAIVRYVP